MQGERIDLEFSEDQGLNNSLKTEENKNSQDDDENAYDPDDPINS